MQQHHGVSQLIQELIKDIMEVTDQQDIGGCVRPILVIAAVSVMLAMVPCTTLMLIVLTAVWLQLSESDK